MISIPIDGVVNPSFLSSFLPKSKKYLSNLSVLGILGGGEKLKIEPLQL